MRLECLDKSHLVIVYLFCGYWIWFANIYFIEDLYTYVYEILDYSFLVMSFSDFGIRGIMALSSILGSISLLSIFFKRL